MADEVKKVEYGALIGLVVAVLGVAASPEYADLLGPKVSGLVTVAGTLLAAIRGALFGSK